MHYLEDVIGVVDQQAAQAGADFEEKEWELDQLEKLKVKARSLLSLPAYRSSTDQLGSKEKGGGLGAEAAREI
jgi:hypothetical protein